MRGGTLLRLLAFALLAAFLLAPSIFAPAFEPLARSGQAAIYDRGDLLSLTLSHLGLVALATLGSTVLGVGLGIFVTRPAGADFLPLSRTVANIGQTFPPVAVLALAVPAVGFGAAPTLIALFLYGLLPIFENTIGGLRAVPPTVLDAARGMGLGPLQRLREVELPLAAPVILAGVRLSAVINLGTATIGSTVAAKGLGEVIIAGLVADNRAFVLQGGLLVALLAVLTYEAMGLVERAAGGRFAAAVR